MKSNMKWFSTALLVLVLTALPLYGASADTTKQGDLAVGGNFAIGGGTAPADGADGGMVIGLLPHVEYFPIDNLGVFLRFLWMRYMPEAAGVSMNADVFPFIFGTRYFFDTPVDGLKPFAGGGLGLAVFHYDNDFSGDDTKARFALDMEGGVEYEVIENLGLHGTFDILLPNVAKTDDGEDVVGFFTLMVGVSYYLPL